ncbi:MAG: DHH family phosphoesterase, partial [Acidobacteriota bacterium]|nr:DHH family phosphoesterase [Acidobacteriota bacterium]
MLAEQHAEQADTLARAARLPHVLAELLLARGVTTASEAFVFLNPAVDHLHDPFLMRGMQAAVDRIERAIAQGEPILLYGDYDVDGTTAVVLLKTAIEMLGGIVRFHVPHRLREGYGLQSSVLEEAYAAGIRLVLTVDTGMRAFSEAETARRLGLDLIITDHHLPDAHEAVPDALAILNPNQPGCDYPEKSLCGAAIALKVAQALLERSHRERTREKTLPSFLKMAAIATIADAVPLKGENRVIAALGLRELRKPVGAGLRALFETAALDPAAKPLTGFDVAFRLAPRINAAGRMDVASDVVELFTTRDLPRARELAAKLDRLNRERRDTEAFALTAIENRLATDAALATERLLVIDGDGWHRGVIGILASRVVERTAKPAIVVSVEDNVAHG